MASLRITTPVGRLVGGSLYAGKTVDDKGVPYLYKSGANKGQQYSKYYIALAVPKAAGETHWAQTSWGAQLWNLGNTLFPAQAQSPLFSWKVEDGDSTIPNKKGRKNCDNEGFPAHWILKFSNNFPFKVCDAKTLTYITEPDAVKLGYYVQVNFDADKNTGDTPGLYLNCNVVALCGYGAEISVGIDLVSAGFGTAPLPPGASAVPAATFAPPANMGVTPPVPAAPTNSPVPTFAPAPNPQFTQVAPPAPPARVMTDKAGGATYEQFKSNPQWTDELLIAQGFMLP